MALSILNQLVHTYDHDAEECVIPIDTVDTAPQPKDLSTRMINKMKDAIKIVCDNNYSLPTSDCQMIISDHLLSLIISFVRGRLPINHIKKPLNLCEAYGELNRRGELEGYCYLKYTDGKTYEGKMCNGEIESTWEYLAQSWAISIGFQSLDLQNNGSFALVLDDKYEINFGLLSQTNEILVVSYLKIKLEELENEIRLKLYELLLKANFAFVDTGFDGYNAALGVCPGAKDVILSITKTFEGMDVKKMTQLFDYMVKASEKWEKKINEMIKKDRGL